MKKIWSMLFTITVTIFLLVTSLFAWFSMNDTVRGDTIGTVTDDSVSYLNCDLYYTTKVNDRIYVDDSVTYTKMRAYNNEEMLPTAIIAKLSYSFSENGLYNFSLIASGKMFSTESTVISNYTDNYISNVITIYEVDILDDNSFQPTNSTTFVNSNYEKISNTIKYPEKEYEANVDYVTYLMLDYNSDMINELYSLMLNNIVDGSVSLETTINFKSDITILLIQE